MKPVISAKKITQVPIDSIEPHPRNPRRGNVDRIVTSMRLYGFTAPCLVQTSTNYIIAGNHRWRAAKQEGYEKVPVIFLDLDDAAAIGLLMFDNKASDDSTYDDQAVADLWAFMAEEGWDLSLTGWEENERAELLARLEAEAASDSQFRDGAGVDDDDDRGEALELLNVTVAEPRWQPQTGDVYRLGHRHIVVVDDVITGWPRWVPYLTEGALFMPYPGTYLPHTIKAQAEGVVLVMVQPNAYLAGHLLDGWAAVHTDDTIEKLG